MRTSVIALFITALVAFGCNKSSGDKDSGNKTSGSQTGTPTTGAKEAAAGSKIEFIGTKPQGKHEGGFKDFTVNIAPIKDDLAGSKISVDIDTDSLYSDNPKLTKHLKSPDFFDVKKYPKATFVSTSVEPKKAGEDTHEITGDLTLHGKTKKISFPAKVAVTPKTVNIDSQFTIDRKDFGMTYGAGKINDTITIKAAIRYPRK